MGLANSESNSSRILEVNPMALNLKFRNLTMVSMMQHSMKKFYLNLPTLNKKKKKRKRQGKTYVSDYSYMLLSSQAGK
jgi:hypothetical protein